jgi:hypothetical protein
MSSLSPVVRVKSRTESLLMFVLLPGLSHMRVVSPSGVSTLVYFPPAPIPSTVVLLVMV